MRTKLWNDTTYSLRNRMWSNITKMWNSDVNAGLSYDSFAQIRNQLGDFPGYSASKGSAAAYTLPAAATVTQVYRADHGPAECCPAEC